MANLAIIKPQPGDEITSPWGTSVADALNGIQTGTVVVTTSGSPPIGIVTVTFPRPYASPPVVMASGNGTGTDNMVTGCVNVTATNFQLSLRANSVFGYSCRWLAVGVPA